MSLRTPNLKPKALWLFETGRIRIPARYHTLISQLRAWHRSADGRIVKRDDHHPDALVAATYAFESGLITHASLGIMPYPGPDRTLGPNCVPWTSGVVRGGHSVSARLKPEWRGVRGRKTEFLSTIPFLVSTLSHSRCGGRCGRPASRGPSGSRCISGSRRNA